MIACDRSAQTHRSHTKDFLHCLNQCPSPLPSRQDSSDKVAWQQHPPPHTDTTGNNLANTLTVKNNYLWFDAGCLKQGTHHHWEVLHKPRTNDFAHPGPSTDHIGYLPRLENGTRKGCVKKKKRKTSMCVQSVFPVLVQAAIFIQCTLYIEMLISLPHPQQTAVSSGSSPSHTPHMWIVSIHFSLLHLHLAQQVHHLLGILHELCPPAPPTNTHQAVTIHLTWQAIKRFSWTDTPSLDPLPAR